MFAFFAKSKKAQEFAREKFNENKDKHFLPRMLSEIDQLYLDAMDVLEKNKTNYPAFINYLK